MVLIFYPIIILVSFFNLKIRKGVKERRGTFQKLANWRKNVNDNASIILVNCSSLGEYEQAKPLIEKIKLENKQIQIALSFFSPSGYEHFKDEQLVAVVFYLPFDLYWKVSKLINIVRPSIIIDTSYDIWPNLLFYAKRKGIDHYLISARLKENTSKLKPIFKSFFKVLFSYYKRIFTVSEIDYKLFSSLLKSSSNLTNTGDTRFDSVEKRYQKFREIKLLPTAWKSEKVLIFGSTHSECYEKIIPAIKLLQNEHKNLHFVIAPHDPDEAVFLMFKEKLNNFEKLSKISPESKAQNIYVDTIGDLAKLYFSSDFAYVGGGFGNDGLHNVMEPAVCGIPIFIGPNNLNSIEA
ncbi:MAG: hypothetical protein PF551_04810, partial [Candidatus Marinimicrobia bacterium]|nr:hypothetical protein [Candidatus Neomarinimicrobiota bacterium]